MFLNPQHYVIAAKNETKSKIPVTRPTAPTIINSPSFSIAAPIHSYVGGPAEIGLAIPKIGRSHIPEHFNFFSSIGKNFAVFELFN